MGSCMSAQKEQPGRPKGVAELQVGTKGLDADGSFLEAMVRRHEGSQRGGNQCYFPKSQTSAFVANLNRLSDEQLLAHWSKQHDVLPEYRQASEAISVTHEWMSNTKLLRHADKIRKRFELGLHQNQNFSDVLERVIKKAYNTSSPRSQKDLLSGQVVFGKVKQCYDSLEPWKKPLFVQAWQVTLESENDKGAIVSKLSEVVDRALHCRQVQVQSFQLVLSYTSCLLDKSDASARDNRGDDNTAALHHVYACFEDFLDDYKEKAFSASFMEPARFYLTNSGIGPHWLRDNVETHANNWYIALLNAALGVHIPLMATYWDDFPPVTCDFWAGLKDEAWHHFSNDENFGRSWQGIAAINRKGASLIARKVSTGFLPDASADSRNTSSALGVSFNTNLRTAKHFANRAVAQNKHAGASVKERKALALYLERFTSFFERDRFVRKAFETLNSECKPEHHGFRTAFQTLFVKYQEEKGCHLVPEESYVEHCYRDDMFTELDLERTAQLFIWLGVLKPPASQNQVKAQPKQNIVTEECPLCCEFCADVQPLLHESDTIRNVSSHRACAHCRKEMVKRNQSCPWCRDNMVWQELFGFLDGLKTNISKANQPDELADLMGTWQEYEMTRPLVDVQKFASDMVEDVALSAHLENVLKKKNVAFMRDSAGLWCRFHAMVEDREISVSQDASHRLARVVQGALIAFEADGGGAPQHVGAMYTQLASAVLCARVSGSSIKTLVQITQRVGRACVRLHQRRFKDAAGVRERLPKDYAMSVSDTVWGSPQQDIVLKQFF